MDKEERINEIVVSGVLADVLIQLDDYHERLDNAQKEIFRVSHNIGITKALVEKALAKLVTGGAVE